VREILFSYDFVSLAFSFNIDT